MLQVQTHGFRLGGSLSEVQHVLFCSHPPLSKGTRLCSPRSSERRMHITGRLAASQLRCRLNATRQFATPQTRTRLRKVKTIFSLRLDNRKASAESSQSNLSGMSACTHLIGRTARCRMTPLFGRWRIQFELLGKRTLHRSGRKSATAARHQVKPKKSKIAP